MQLARYAQQAQLHELAYVLRVAASLASAKQIEWTPVAEQFLGTWHWDVPRDLVFMEPLAASLFAIDLTDAVNGLPLARFTSAIHKEDAERMIGASSTTPRRGGPFSEIYRTVVQNRTYRILAQGFVSLDAMGRPLGFNGVIFDFSAETNFSPTHSRIKH